MSDDAEAERRTAAKLAGNLGCSGTHEHDGRILPCRTHDELLARSKAAENFTKSADPRRRRKRKVSSRRGKGWENLRERPTSSLATGGAGITSGSPGSEITDSGPTGSTGTAVSGGIMGGVVDGSFGVASLEGSGILDAKEDGRRRAEGSRRPVPVPVERKTAKALPRDADHDGWAMPPVGFAITRKTPRPTTSAAAFAAVRDTTGAINARSRSPATRRMGAPTTTRLSIGAPRASRSRRRICRTISLRPQEWNRCALTPGNRISRSGY